MTEKWLKQKRAELKDKLARLGAKMVHVTAEVKKFGPKKVRRGFQLVGAQRGGMYKHWHKMALRSLSATKKKIFAVKEELSRL